MRDDVLPRRGWQEPSWNRVAFGRISEVLPVARVSRGEGPVRALLPDPHDLSRARVHVDGGRVALEPALEGSHTDGIVVLRDGRIAFERYAPGLGERQPHLLMSVTKSLVGLLAGCLLAEGLVAEHDPVELHVPELLGTAWAGASVRHLLDMEAGIRFREDYDDPTAEFAEYDRRIGWAPATAGAPEPDGVKAYVRELAREGEPGGLFAYQSVTTDVLGWVLERAGGARWDALLGSRLWERIGAERDLDVVLDAAGWPLADGGACATVRDLARVGQLLVDGGTVGEAQVVPAAWVDDLLHPPATARDRFRGSAAAHDLGMPHGAYRSQWWSVDPDGGVVTASGIHGQTLLVDVPNRLVVAKVASWPAPWDPVLAHASVAVARAVRDALAR